MNVRSLFVGFVRSYVGCGSSPKNHRNLIRYSSLINAPGYERKSGCGLVCRGWLRQFLESPPPRISGAYQDQQAISDLVSVGLYADALRRAGEGTPAPGDIVHVAGNATGCEHVFVLTEIDGTSASGVEGGQSDPDDAGQQIILERKRTIEVVDGAMFDAVVNGPRRAVANWIDLEQLVACFGLAPAFARGTEEP